MLRTKSSQSRRSTSRRKIPRATIRSSRVRFRIRSNGWNPRRPKSRMTTAPVLSQRRTAIRKCRKRMCRTLPSRLLQVRSAEISAGFRRSFPRWELPRPPERAAQARRAPRTTIHRARSAAAKAAVPEAAQQAAARTLRRAAVITEKACRLREHPAAKEALRRAAAKAAVPGVAQQAAAKAAVPGAGLRAAAKAAVPAARQAHRRDRQAAPKRPPQKTIPETERTSRRKITS